MNFNKIRSFCRVFRIILGVALIVTGIIQWGASEYAPWFFLGIIPLAAGLLNFCPLCIISKKCDL
ncbi:MAG: DUF2892 domain-containing protein [Epsilonproteobacteria bacterium]|nr:DUF2892 domain-containing protein [Campylobacterota bacterium]OIO16882.1 MAG: hypothetical protein AUJ81_03315 [Helicobacteraceae bacterium CG1_02_36_14]PIP09202.1 MAG: hypothetical protein COX50_11950 [Sulfurimonas sp. CG23_combo_of_CG06-09_8_20_14_all_36_33]PIS24615.1 MAG: DUF2892 domain-containing protein [Sulfurimonas sp. CG08_land_8_20_14_0_20_36_33]PIU34964.1 MAG: DUF2892 domain-containing protein [Sulfurimonas sp. CG07_land_8_20_14_0_80_36_56]PIV02944.1 MAG: DUF2892 domain-containing